MSGTVDGVSLAVEGVDVAYSPANVNIVAVSNTAPTCEFFSILIWGDVVANGPATYSAGGRVPEISALYNLRSPPRGWRADALVGSGSLTVTKVTPAAVAGTFAFRLVPDPSLAGNTASGMKVITNGVFDVALGSAPTDSAFSSLTRPLLAQPPNSRMEPTRR